MAQSQGNYATPVKSICEENKKEFPKSVAVAEVLNEEDIPDDDPLLIFEWEDQNCQIFLNRWQALEEADNAPESSFPRPHSVGDFRQRMLELFANGIPGATLGQGGGNLIRCATSIPFSIVVVNMAIFESRQWVRAILGEEGLPGKLAHVAVATSVHQAQYPTFNIDLF